MSERKRCTTITYLGTLDGTDGRATKGLRAICDRPIGHSATTHKGRLAFGMLVWGIVEWTAGKP